MTAIFTGLGSGFERGSANILGSGGQIGGGTLGRANEGVSVNAATGNLLITNQDEFLVGRGLDIGISRTYNSLAEASDGDNNDQWQQSTHRRVFDFTGTQNANGSSIKRQGADGSVITYTWNASKAAYLSTDGTGAYDQLTKVGSVWKWKDGATNVTESYSAYGSNSWRITEQRDNDNYKLSFTYSGAKLSKVTTANGEWTQYIWSGNNIARITTGYTDLATSTAKTLTRTYYGYDASNRLVTVSTDLSPENNSLGSDKYVTTYTYQGSTNRVATISQTDGSHLAMLYDGSGRVTRLTQTVASGDTRITNIAYGSNYTNITSPDGQLTRMDYDAKKQLTKITAPPAYSGAAAQTVQFLYDANGNVTRVTDAAGKATTHTYNANGNRVYTTDPNGNTTYRWYDTNNNLIKTRTYGSGASWANVAQYTRYAYDSENHLRYAISSEGHVTEYRYTGVGQLRYEIEYPEHIYNTSSTIPTTAQMDAWLAGLGDKSSAKILRHDYDARGNKTRIWNYGYATAAGGASNAEGYSRAYFTYDQTGQLLSRYSGSEISETFVYDGMGRVTASTDLAGGTTSFVFQDAASKTIVTTASGHVTTNTYNKAGELISQTTAGSYDVTGTSTYKYDKNGRLRQSTDETGYNNYYHYDRSGRKVADINHYGHMTEYRYDAAGWVNASVSYTYAISAAKLAQLGDPNNTRQITTLPPSAHSNDIWEWNVYDAKGRVIQTIDGTGGVAKFEYDKSDRLVKTTSYYNKLSAAQLTSFKANAPTSQILPAAHANDSFYRTFYDRDGRLIGKLGGEGYLTEIKYDKAGQKIEEIAYANPTSASHRVSHSFATLRNVADNKPAADIRTRYVYDGQGKLRYTVKADGSVSSFTYNIAGKLTKTVEHAATINTTDFTYDNIETKVAAIASSANDRTSSIAYNSRGQINYTQDVAGLRTYFTYDNRGQVTKTVTGTGGAARTVRNWYTAGGDLRFTVDAEGYVKRFDYDKESRLTREVAWSNPVSTTDSTTISQINSLANGAGTWVDTRYTYDAAGRQNSTYDGEGSRTFRSFWATGMLANEWQAHGTADQSQSHFVYDGAGRLVREIHGLGQSERADTTYSYDGLGNLTSSTDPNGKTTTYTYDKAGRVLTETNAADGVTSYEYNAFGQVVKVTDPRGNASYNYYDNLGRLTKTRDAESYVTETTYTIYGEVESVKRRYNRTTSAVSTVTPPTVSNHAKDATTSFEYDKRGLVTKSTDAEGFFETYTYDAFGQRITSKAKSSTISKVAGGTTSYAYDKRGLLISETLPIKSYSNTGAVQASTVVNSFTYDARGNRLTMVEASNIATVKRTTTYKYDKANRLIETTGQTFQGLTPKEYIAYDARGNVTRTIDAAGAKTVFFYDDLNRKTVEINALGTYTKYTYDKNGNVTEARVYSNTVSVPADGGSEEEQPNTPSGGSRVTTFTYDNLNRMTKSAVAAGVQTGYYNGSAWAAVATAIETHYQYDANGNVVKMTDPNGNTTWSYYDNSGRKTAQVDGERYRTDWTYDSEGNVLRERRYVNKAANPTSVVNPPSVSANSGLDRITDFTYDTVGNRLTETRLNVLVHNGNGAQSNAHATIRYTYNGLGQVIAKEESTGVATTTIGDETTTYKYDAGGRLEEEKRSSFTSHQNATVTPEVDYYYDGLGNLSRTVAAGAGDAASRITRYDYNGDKLQKMTDAEGFVRHYKYDAAGRTTHEYYKREKSNGALTSTYDGTLTVYDKLGRATQQYQATSSNGSSWADSGPRAVSSYNAYGEVASVAVGGITQQRNNYDDAGRLWATNSGDGVWKYFGYDKNGNQTIALTSAGANLNGGSNTGVTFSTVFAQIGQTNVNATYTQYDNRNLATKVVEEGRQLATTGALQTLNTTRVYNAFGEVTAETNALNATINYTYNNMGRLIKSESPQVSITAENGAVSNVRPTEHYYYDVSGRLVASRDANGNLNKLTLLAGTGYGGSQALVTQETHADGGLKKTKYDIHGDARTMIDEINRTSTQVFDKMGRVERVNHAGGLIDRYAHDGLGQQIRHWNNQLNPGNTTTGLTGEAEKTDYDTQGRVISSRAFGGDTTTTSYAWKTNFLTTGFSTTALGGWEEITTYANGKKLTERTDLFGRMTYKNDLGNHVTNFTYDKAGRLASTTTNGLTTSFTQLNTGLVGKMLTVVGTVSNTTDWTRETATYTYDKIGNRTKEQFRKETGDYTPAQMIWWNPYEPDFIPATYVTTNVLVKNATTTYDALGRMTTWTEAGSSTSPAASITYKYDANGNIRNQNTTFRSLDANGNAASTPTIKDYWFRFDNMNRVVTSNGEFSGGVITRGAASYIGAGGQDILYDKAGQRIAVLATEFYQDGYVGMNREVRETYTYDAAGRLSKSHVTRGVGAFGGGAIPAAPLPNVNSSVNRRSLYYYDLMGRQTAQYDYEINGTTVAFSRTSAYNAKSQVTTDTTNTKRGNDIFRTTTGYNYGYGTGYALGTALIVTATNYKNNNSSQAPNTRTTNSVQWWDGAVQSTIQYDGDTGNGSNPVYLTTFNYDARGRLLTANVGDYYAQTVTFTNDELGQIIRRDETSIANSNGAPHEVWYRFNGAQLGYTGNNGTSDVGMEKSIQERQATPPTTPGVFRGGATNGISYADFAQSYDPLNSYAQGAGTGSYTVRQGDTLQGIAQQVYGDASLWYKIAEANGIGANGALVKGQNLRLPAGVVKNTHNANTFKPYNPAENIGDLTPTTNQPPKKNKCGTFGAILLAVVAVAVATIVTAGAASVLTGATFANSLGAVFSGSLVGFGTSSTVLTGIGAIGVTAAGAVAGSIVSQGLGVATGIQNKFSWKGVALAGIGSFVSGGINGVFGPAGNAAGAAAQAAAGSAITQGLGVATGLQDKFNWAGVAAAGIGAAAGHAFGDQLAGKGVIGIKAGEGTFGNFAGATASSAIANAATRSAVNGESFGKNLIASIPDVVAQLLKRAIGTSADAIDRPSDKVNSDPVSERPMGYTQWLEKNYHIPAEVQRRMWEAQFSDEVLFGGQAPSFDADTLGFGRNNEGMVYASWTPDWANELHSWADRDGDGSLGWGDVTTGASEIVTSITGKTPQQLRRDFNNYVTSWYDTQPIVVTANRTTSQNRATNQNNAIVNQNIRASIRSEPSTNSSWLSLPSFEWPSVRWNQMASRLPSLDAGIRAQMNGAGRMEASIAQSQGTRNFIAQGIGNLSLGLWETNVGFVSTAAAPPTVVLTEGSSSPYVQGGGRAGFFSSPWFGLAGEAFIASRIAAPLSRGAGTGPTEAYNRLAHYGRTPTAADRRAIGAGPGEVADHTPPLVQRYYKGDPSIGEKPGWQMTPAERARSAADRNRMSPQPRADSNSQGGQMSAYSREMRRRYGL